MKVLNIISYILNVLFIALFVINKIIERRELKEYRKRNKNWFTGEPL
jgi:hypothetical protein